MNELFEKVGPTFSKFQHENHVEMELRLGKMNRGTFDTNVGQETFEKVLRGLNKYTGWEKVIKKSDVAYYKDDIRLVIDEDTDESTQVSKQKLVKIDHTLPKQPLDVRFAVAKEIPCSQDVDEYLSAKKRTRESFVRKNLSIDMTIVSGNPSDMDSEEENSYQIEFEIIDPKKVTDNATLYNIVYKVQDVLTLILTA
jgi:hypothetical protein